MKLTKKNQETLDLIEKNVKGKFTGNYEMCEDPYYVRFEVTGIMEDFVDLVGKDQYKVNYDLMQNEERMKEDTKYDNFVILDIAQLSRGGK